MYKVIKEIRKIIGEHFTSDLKIQIFSDNSVSFLIYETEVSVVIDFEDKCSYVDCETSNNDLTASMLKELSEICKLLDDNITMLSNLINKELDY